MKLVKIPDYYNYRIDAMFDCYKWDPQFEDANTLSEYALVLTKEEAEEVATLTEQLEQETEEVELLLKNHLRFAKQLQIPKDLWKELKKMRNYNPQNHIRLTRYDFHQTIDNKWVISEINSDVPGGFAESSLLPKLAIQYLKKPNYTSIDFGENLQKVIQKKVKPNGTIMLAHCTSFSDDRQVMQYLGDELSKKNYQILYGSVDHITFKNKEAYSILEGYKQKIDGMIRFTPLEWIAKFRPKTWKGLFDTTTPSCNFPIAIFTQTKRFPLIWDTLEKNNIKINTWKKLLPKTMEIKKVSHQEKVIYKPAWGRVGENISIKEACSEKEYETILKDVKKHPKKYIAQEKFISKPLETSSKQTYHICLGSYAIDKKHGGFYARMSSIPRIDSQAQDIPVIIERT